MRFKDYALAAEPMPGPAIAINAFSNDRVSNNGPCRHAPNVRRPIRIRDEAVRPNDPRCGRKRHSGFPILHRSTRVLGWDVRGVRSPALPVFHAHAHILVRKRKYKGLLRALLRSGPEQPICSDVFSFVRFLALHRGCNSHARLQSPTLHAPHPTKKPGIPAGFVKFMHRCNVIAYLCLQ